jgi:hypothetical protein
MIPGLSKDIKIGAKSRTVQDSKGESKSIFIYGGSSEKVGGLFVYA